MHIPANDLAGSTVALQGSVATRHRGGPTRLGGRTVPDAVHILCSRLPRVNLYGAEESKRFSLRVLLATPYATLGGLVLRFRDKYRFPATPAGSA